jgi:hypothetical protein
MSTELGHEVLVPINTILLLVIIGLLSRRRISRDGRMIGTPPRWEASLVTLAICAIVAILTWEVTQ